MKKRSSLITVVIPVRNRVRLLLEALSSLAESEVICSTIVVDDGSSESLAEAKRHLRGTVTWLESGGRGPGAARNLGAAAATTEYLVFLDSDDLFFRDTLAAIEEAIYSASRRPAVVLMRPLPFRSDRQPVLQRNRGELSLGKFDDIVTVPGYLRRDGIRFAAIRRDIFRHVGGFNENVTHCEDLDLLLRVGAGFPAVFVLEPPLLAYRKHSDQAVNSVRAFVDGHKFLRAQLDRGAYPASNRLKRHCIDWIAESARMICCRLILAGDVSLARKFYFSTAVMQLRMGKLRFLAGFWWLWFKSLVRH